MKPMKLVLASTAAAVLAAFNPAFAGGDAEYKYKKDSSASSEGKLTGLDRADQAAGEHGQQGRDNAREKQESAASPGSGTALGDSTAGAEPGRDALLEREQVSQAPGANVDARTGLDKAHPAN
jgi:hypothetical protein